MRVPSRLNGVGRRPSAPVAKASASTSQPSSIRSLTSAPTVERVSPLSSDKSARELPVCSRSRRSNAIRLMFLTKDWSHLIGGVRKCSSPKPSSSALPRLEQAGSAAARDAEIGAGDVGRRIGEKKHDALRDLRRRADALHRDQRHDLRHPGRRR